MEKNELIKLLASNNIEIKLSTKKQEPFSDVTDLEIYLINSKNETKNKVIGLEFLQEDKELIKHIKDLYHE